jgi:hypothetical protein
MTSRQKSQGCLQVIRLHYTVHKLEEIMMNKFQSALRASLFVAITLAFSALAQAQATRTWVSGVGDDANPCSRTAPCKTFAGAISKTTVGGEIDALDPGGFGTLTITKSITIDGTGTFASTLASGTTGFTINIPPGTADAARAVRLRGLSINGAGSGIHGIRVIAANNVSVEDTVIDGFSKDGISVETKSAQVFVKETTIRNNGGSGINVVAGGSQLAISDVTVLYNGTGLAAGGGTIISFNNNVIYGNKKDGDPTSSAAPRKGN